MKKIVFSVLVFMVLGSLSAAPLTPAQKTLVDAQLKSFLSLGTDPQVVNAVKVSNISIPSELVGMTQEKWEKLSILGAEIKLLSKNDLANYLKTKRTEIVTELFVNNLRGEKVAFFGKTTGWIHLGKPKHDQPMLNKTWVGEPELDASTGKYSVQVSFPVLDGGKPIGSIVIGLDLGQLK